MFIDSRNGGKIFPLERLTIKNIDVVTGLKSVGIRGEMPIFGDAPTNAGAEGKINRATFVSACFINGSETSVISEKNWTFKKIVYKSSEIKILPGGKIGKGNRAIVLHDAGYGDDNGANVIIFGDEKGFETVRKIFGELVRVGIGEKAEFLFAKPELRKKHNLCFGATDIDSEIHALIISCKKQKRA